jgi:Kdo2-lipid IVA lauroyltransferase/acyltransferase
MKKVLWGLSKISLYLLSLIPFPVLYLISDFCYYVIFYIIKYRRHVVMPNLRNSFPEKPESELRIIEKKYFKFLCDNILESFKMLTISKEEIAKRYVIRNPEEIRKHLDKGKSIIVTGGHYGNWEWGNLAMTQFNETVLIIYKPLADKKFEAFMNGMRSRFGSIMVPMKLTLRKIIEQKNNQYLAFFASDQTPAKVDRFEFIKFLNQDTAVFLGTEKIATTTGNPVVYCHVNQLKRGYYEVIFTTLFEDPKATAPLEITLTLSKKLESYIRARPELWLWSHKRWKFKPENVGS